MLEIDQLIDVLRDGGWHSIAEVVEKCGLSLPKVKSIMEFLIEYEFVEVNVDGRKVKIASSLREFLLKTEI